MSELALWPAVLQLADAGILARVEPAVDTEPNGPSPLANFRQLASRSID